MARNLADMIDDDTMEGMAISAGQKGTNGEQIREMYGLARPDGPESLRAALRCEFGEPAGRIVVTHVEDYRVNPHVMRVLEMLGIDPSHLAAVSLWAETAIDVEVDERVSLSVFANGMADRLGVSLRLGSGQEAMWEFDEDEDGPDCAGGIEIMRHPLPATVLVALAGKPLESVLTHPVTDGAGLVIAEAEHYEPNNSTYLKLARAQADPKGKA